MNNQELDLKLPDKNGYYALPPGKLATLTTYYERLGPFSDAMPEWPDTIYFTRLGSNDTDAYRQLFKLVGENLLWVSRLAIEEKDLIGVLSDPEIEAYAITLKGVPVGLLEIDFKQAGNGEIVYFGLKSDATGLKIGRAMMNLVFAQAERRKINRVWLHTCHFDSSHAPRFYEKFGFRAYQLAVEIMDDPRIKGTLPKEAAPHIPLILSK